MVQFKVRVADAGPAKVGGDKENGLPRERMFDAHGTIDRIDKATEADKKNRVLVTINIKGSDIPVQITVDTELQIAKGKLVERGSVDDLSVGDRVSAWYKDRPAKSERRAIRAERLMLFRPGQPALPPVP
jgi:hypothetical protein